MDEYNGRGLGGGCGPVGLIGLIVAVIVAGLVGLVFWSDIQGSSADRAQAQAAEAQAYAGARAAEAQAETDQAQIKADRDVELKLAEQAYKIDRLEVENRQFQERLIMLSAILENGQAEELADLQAQLSRQRAIPYWVVAGIAAWCALVGLLVWVWTRLTFRPQIARAPRWIAPSSEDIDTAGAGRRTQEVTEGGSNG